MHTLILSSNLQQAAFIKKGLIYENLTSEILPVDTGGQPLMKKLSNADGIFILTEFAGKITKTVENCGKIKPGAPIIILAGHNNPAYEALLMENSIINYFVRPYPFRQMAADMKYAIFRNREKVDIGKFILRDLEVDILSHQVNVHNAPVYLRNKEFSLLHYMMVNKGRVLTRSDILQNVWDRNTNILTNTVDVHVSQLRKKIDGNDRDKYIRTVPCMGYMLE